MIHLLKCSAIFISAFFNEQTFHAMNLQRFVPLENLWLLKIRDIPYVIFVLRLPRRHYDRINRAQQTKNNLIFIPNSHHFTISLNYGMWNSAEFFWRYRSINMPTSAFRIVFYIHLFSIRVTIFF